MSKTVYGAPRPHLNIMFMELRLFCSLFAHYLLHISSVAAEAHYQAQIRCIGGPPYDLAPYPGQFPLEVGLHGPFTTARSTCAKAIYGGNNYINAGAFCHWEASPPTVVFENTTIHRAGRDIPYAVLAFCLNRCRCLKDLSPEAARDGTIPAAEIVASEFQYETRFRTGFRPYDVNPARSNFWRTTPAFYPRFINTIDVFFAREDDLGVDKRHVFNMPALIHDGPRAPRCNGNLPPWGDTFPFPFRVNMFSTLKELCVVSYFGGSMKGNAGLQCDSHHQLEVVEEFLQYVFEAHWFFNHLLM